MKIYFSNLKWVKGGRPRQVTGFVPSGAYMKDGVYWVKDPAELHISFNDANGNFACKLEIARVVLSELNRARFSQKLVDSLEEAFENGSYDLNAKNEVSGIIEAIRTVKN